MKLLILADDLTGALDTGVQLSRRHIPTTVLTNIEDNHASRPLDCQVLSVNLECRHLAEADTYARTRATIEKYATPGHYVYVKTDSALRGSTGAMFAAALDAIGGPICFTPALPRLGRITKEGVCYIGGELLERSVFRNDPRTPTTKSYIPDILNNSMRAITCTRIPFANIGSFDSLRENAPADVYLFDCESEGQMTAIGNVLGARRLYGLTAGCAGFAATFDAHIPFQKRTPTHVHQPGPLLLISGSANAVTLSQLALARQQGIPVFSMAEAICDAYRKKVPADPASLPVCREALSCFLRGRSVVLATAASDADLRKAEDDSFHETVARTMSCLVQYFIEQAGLCTLAVFGGDMVAAILRQLGCSRADVCLEVADGVPVCTFTYGGQPFTLVTKSGGFGEPDVVTQIIQYFK